FDLRLVDGAAAHGYTRRMHRLRIAGEKRMPPVEVPALLDEPITAGRRQPAQRLHLLDRQPYAVRHMALAVGIIGASAAVAVEQPAADVGPDDLAGILVFE